jgi:hypothetical protein
MIVKMKKSKGSSSASIVEKKAILVMSVKKKFLKNAPTASKKATMLMIAPMKKEFRCASIAENKDIFQVTVLNQ